MKKNKKLILAILIFTLVFVSFALALHGGWFWVDDLGVILNGLIKKFSDIGKILTDDSRNYATTYNYNLPKSNFISGFMRPMQQFFFSFIYYFFGTNLLAFQLLQVFFHAANATLLFFLFSYWLPISFSCFGSLLFAFYPNMGWLGWMCTLQHSLALFFLILSILILSILILRILLYTPLLKTKFNNKKLFFKSPLFYLSGLAFFFSLLSRETHMFLAPYIFVGVFLFCTNISASFMARAKESLAKSSLFFISTIIYFCMRIYAFGFGSLARTARNVLIRFPFLTKFFAQTTQKIESVKPIVKEVIKTQIPATQVVQIKTSFSQIIFKKINILANKFFAWTKIIFNYPSNTCFQKLVIIFFIIFLISFLVISYKKQKKIGLFLLLGIPFFIWPCILVYPATRYMNTAYPLLIFIVLLGAYFCVADTCVADTFIHRPTKLRKISFLILFLFLNYASIAGFYTNIIRPALTKKSDKPGEIYTNFFKDHKIPKNSNLIFISTLDESDLEQILQAVSQNFELRVAHIVISKLANKGQYNFQEDYSLTGYPYKVSQIKDGYRFTSQDKKHCGWTFHSYQPVIWSEKERAYVLTPEFFKENIWHKFSMGKFLIHETYTYAITDTKYVTDVSFVFDKKWITPNTFFVIWDTMEKRYKIIDRHF